MSDPTDHSEEEENDNISLGWMEPEPPVKAMTDWSWESRLWLLFAPFSVDCCSQDFHSGLLDIFFHWRSQIYHQPLVGKVMLNYRSCCVHTGCLLMNATKRELIILARWLLMT